jgi:toxin ParE1/3/4
MSAKEILRREVADEDIDDAISYYEGQSEQATIGFIDDLQRTYKKIAASPKIGSPRYAYQLDLPGFLCRKLDKYPYMVFYFEHDDHIDVWRVLHEKRDIPNYLD